MVITKKIGIWMNHSIAYIMEFTAGLITTIIVESDNEKDKQHTFNLENDNFSQFTKEQIIQTDFYKKMSEQISECQQVILFGPTYAKVNFYHQLKADSRFSKTRIDVTQAQEMNQIQQQDFVTNHFSKKL